GVLRTAGDAARSAGVVVVRSAASGTVLAALAGEARKAGFRPATHVVGYVRQDVDTVVEEVPSRRFPIATALAEGLHALDSIDPWVPNEVTLSRYPRGGGVTAHRDHVRYKRFVATLTVSGFATFEQMADRDTPALSWLIGPG